MKYRRLSILFALTCFPFLLMLGFFAGHPNQGVHAAQIDDPKEESDYLALVSEITGMEASETAASPACSFDASYQVYLCPPAPPETLPVRNPEAKKQAFQLLGSVGLLMVPESDNDRVMAFDPVTGDLVDADFIPADPADLTIPIQAILSASGDSFLVSDQTRDVVQEYDLAGNYVGVFAPAGGANNAILDNIRGIEIGPNGNLLVTNSEGGNSDAVAEFDTSGNYLGNFIANGAGGMDSPFDVQRRAADWLVSGINSDAVHRYDLAGVFIGNLTAINNFPEQIYEIATGNVLVANFGGTQEGVLEYQANGTFVGLYHPPTLGGYRGVYELGNGNILTTNEDGVYEIDRAGNLVETKISGVNARFIEFIQTGPNVRLDKTVGTNPAICADNPSISVPSGTDVTYCYTVTNTGFVPLTRHDLADSELGVILSNFPFTLNPGASAFLTQTTTILTDTVNTGIWTAYNPGPIDVVSSTDTATVTMLSPSILLAKTVGTNPAVCAATDSISVFAGTDVTYCYTIENTGPITLTHHDLADSELGIILTGFPFTLVPGASAFLTQTTTILTNTANSATWTAYTPGPNNQVSSTDVATVTLIAPEIMLTKTVGTDSSICAITDTITVTVGTDVTYCYRVTNMGVLTVTKHDLTDDQLGVLLSDFNYLLPPGSSAFFTATTPILVNTTNLATWTAETNLGEVASAVDSAIVMIEPTPSSLKIYLPIVIRAENSAIQESRGIFPALSRVPMAVFAPLAMLGVLWRMHRK